MSSGKPYISRYLRKENYESLNYPSPQRPSPVLNTHTQDLSIGKRSLQQKQIQDLEQKVDIILEHNDKLSIENSSLKQRLAEIQMLGVTNLQKERMSRYQIEDSQYAIRKIKSELQIKVRECEMLSCENESIKEASKKEIQALRIIISNLTLSNQQAKTQIFKISQDILKIHDEQEAQKRIALKELQRKMQEDASRAEKELIQELTREKTYHNKVVDEISTKFQQERNQWNHRKNTLINKLQQTHNKQINELRDQMITQFNQELYKLEEQATERCKNQREKAENFIKESLRGQQASNQAQASSLREQIKLLQMSLQNRKRLISELTTNQLEHQSQKQNFLEVLQIRQRLKDQINHLMRENEMLKIKTAEKYQKDLNEMVKIYGDKIDILTSQIKYLTNQNERLRANYEGELENKIKQKRNWEVQAANLKNLIRKMKVELQGIQDEFRINIDGIRDQNATFSMTLMKSMIQERDKGNFFEQENRKLRNMYEKHQREVQVEKKQINEKIMYYQGKLEHSKKLLQTERDEIQQKENLLDKNLRERQDKMRQNLRRERGHMQQLIAQSQNRKEDLEKRLIDANEKYDNLVLELKQIREDRQALQTRNKENQQHIQRLRMELQMAGTDDRQKNSELNHWKEHFEGIILKLEGDKRELKQVIDSLNAKVEKFVYKYRLLEEELRKAGQSLSKRGQLDKRIIELGMDQNLTKNAAQLWKK